eukprot:4670065-Lingulodinium_polyedra.AAC.1
MNAVRGAISKQTFSAFTQALEHNCAPGLACCGRLCARCWWGARGVACCGRPRAASTRTRLRQPAEA